MRERNCFLPFVTGVIAGVVAGLLMAPKSGEDTLGELKEKIDKAKLRVDELYAKSMEKKEELIAKGREKVRGIVENDKGKSKE